jgi:hypothetical protein
MRALLMRSKRRGIPWLRAAQASLMTGVPFEREVEVEPAVLGGVPCVWHAPRGRRPERSIVYYHGGGFVLGSVAGHRDLLSRLALGAEARVLGVGKPRGPLPRAQRTAPPQRAQCSARSTHAPRLRATPAARSWHSRTARRGDLP